nr:MAG TPA: hypothetical protein [Caudoviricetes sp.]
MQTPKDGDLGRTNTHQHFHTTKTTSQYGILY